MALSQLGSSYKFQWQGYDERLRDSLQKFREYFLSEKVKNERFGESQHTISDSSDKNLYLKTDLFSHEI